MERIIILLGFIFGIILSKIADDEFKKLKKSIHILLVITLLVSSLFLAQNTLLIYLMMFLIGMFILFDAFILPTILIGTIIALYFNSFISLTLLFGCSILFGSLQYHKNILSSIKFFITRNYIYLIIFLTTFLFLS